MKASIVEEILHTDIILYLIVWHETVYFKSDAPPDSCGRLKEITDEYFDDMWTISFCLQSKVAWRWGKDQGH